MNCECDYGQCEYERHMRGVLWMRLAVVVMIAALFFGGMALYEHCWQLKRDVTPSAEIHP